MICQLVNIDGLAQDSSNSIANALELLQSCTNNQYDLFATSSPTSGIYHYAEWGLRLQPRSEWLMSL